MSSGLAKLLDKAFVLGYVLPSLIFLTATFSGFGVFGCPTFICSASKGATTNPFAQLTYAALCVYLLAVLLMAMNYAFSRFFEGYLPPVSWLRFLKAFHRNRQERLERRITALGDDPRADSMTWRLRQQYPKSPANTLPTAFGNAIRAFELYPVEAYGVDAISAWPRLNAVVPKNYQTLINDAKALVDLHVNLAALSLGLFLFSLTMIAFEHAGIKLPIGAPHTGGKWIIVATVSLFVSFAAYRFSLSLIPDWGDYVKGAFDCYLPKLARQLGYAMPTDCKQRRSVWLALSKQMLYGDVFDPPYASGADGPGA